MRLHFAKKPSSSSSSTTESNSSNQRQESTVSSAKKKPSRDLLLFYNEHDERTIMECSVDSFSLSTRTSESSKETMQNKQSGNNKNRKNRNKKQSHLKKLMCFSEGSKKKLQQDQERQDQEQQRRLTEEKTDKDTVYLATTKASTLMEYRPVPDQRQDDEYCPEGYQYLNPTSKMQKTKQQQECEATVDTTANGSSGTATITTITQQDQQQPSPSPLPSRQLDSQTRTRSTATPKTCSSSVSNTLEFEDSVADTTELTKDLFSPDKEFPKVDMPDRTNVLTRQKDGTIVASKLQNPKEVMARHKVSKKNKNKDKKRQQQQQQQPHNMKIPILQVVDTKTRQIIPPVVESQTAEDHGIEVLESDHKGLSDLVVRPTWTTEEVPAGDLSQQLSEDPNLIKHPSFTNNKNRSVTSFATTESMLREDCTKVTKDVTYSLWNNFLLVPPPPTLRQQSKVLRVPTLPKKQEEEEDQLETDVEEGVDSRITACEEPKTDKDDEQRDEDEDQALYHAGVAGSVSFAAIDLPSSAKIKLDNTRNEIAWHRCMARKGARLLNSAGGSFRNKVRRKSSLKKPYNKPSQDMTAAQKENPLTTVVEEAGPQPKRSASGTVRRAKCSAVPVGLCTGPYHMKKCNPDLDDDDDDDSSILVPANTRLERTRSPVPHFKKRGSFTSDEDEDDNALNPLGEASGTNSWMYTWFQQKKDDEGGESLVMDTSLEEDETLGTNSVDEDEEDLDDVAADMPAMRDELVYQAQQLGRSLSHLFENASTTSKGNQVQEDPVIPIIVYQQPDSAWKMNATRIQPEDYEAPRMSLAL